MATENRKHILTLLSYVYIFLNLFIGYIYTKSYNNIQLQLITFTFTQ